MDENDRSTSETKGKKRKRVARSLSMFDISEIAVSKGIRIYLDLLALAKRQKKEGKNDLAQFIVNRGKKTVEEAIKTGWDIEESEEKLERAKMTRLEILGKELEGECVDGCNRQWLDMATNVLQLNGINRNIFSQSVRELLEKGRGKYRNMYLKGPASCGKTFLFNPLSTIFNTFVNPASTSFAWV